MNPNAKRLIEYTVMSSTAIADKNKTVTNVSTENRNLITAKNTSYILLFVSFNIILLFKLIIDISFLEAKLTFFYFF